MAQALGRGLTFTLPSSVSERRRASLCSSLSSKEILFGELRRAMPDLSLNQDSCKIRFGAMAGQLVEFDQEIPYYLFDEIEVILIRLA